MNSNEMVFLQNDGISSNEYNINSLFLKGLLEAPCESIVNTDKTASMIKNSIYERIFQRFCTPNEKDMCDSIKDITQDDKSIVYEENKTEENEIEEIKTEDKCVKTRKLSKTPNKIKTRRKLNLVPRI